MNWKRIPKENTQQPLSGTYKEWKSILADEGFHQCVYCSISEANFGGIRNFHVEHYKPKGNIRFSKLENVISNLFYSCAICNCFKSDDWPDDPNSELNIACYPDPSVVDYSNIFDIDVNTGLLDGKNVAARYILYKLFLNRPQLIINRREELIERKYNQITRKAHSQIELLILSIQNGELESCSLLMEIHLALKDLEDIFHAKNLSTPYTEEQVQRK